MTYSQLEVLVVAVVAEIHVRPSAAVVVEVIEEVEHDDQQLRRQCIIPPVTVHELRLGHSAIWEG